jgi:Domain of Unknown Function (DUF1080)
MKNRFLGLGIVLLALILLPAWGPQAADDKKDDDKGWVQLFNGKDLTGWKLYPQPNPKDIQKIIKKEEGGKVIAYYGKLKEDGSEVPLWRVEDGLLIGSGPHSHLFSERGDYQNFRYRVEAMINDGGNSGQYFRTRFGPDFPNGYEAQINATHSDKIRTGSLYLPKVKEVLVYDAPNKPDEWFTQEVIAEGNHIVIKVNGKTTVDYRDPQNRYKKGHFALQGHDKGTVVKFKKVEVMELPHSK